MLSFFTLLSVSLSLTNALTLPNGPTTLSTSRVGAKSNAMGGSAPQGTLTLAPAPPPSIPSNGTNPTGNGPITGTHTGKTLPTVTNSQWPNPMDTKTPSTVTNAPAKGTQAPGNAPSQAQQPGAPSQAPQQPGNSPSQAPEQPGSSPSGLGDDGSDGSGSSPSDFGGNGSAPSEAPDTPDSGSSGLPDDGGFSGNGGQGDQGDQDQGNQDQGNQGQEPGQGDQGNQGQGGNIVKTATSTQAFATA